MRFELLQTEILAKVQGAKDINLVDNFDNSFSGKTTSQTKEDKKRILGRAGFKIK